MSKKITTSRFRLRIYECDGCNWQREIFGEDPTAPCDQCQGEMKLVSDQLLTTTKTAEPYPGPSSN